MTKRSAMRLRQLMLAGGFTVKDNGRAIKTGYSVTIPFFTRVRQQRIEHFSWVWPVLSWLHETRAWVASSLSTDPSGQFGSVTNGLGMVAISGWRDDEKQTFELGLSMVFADRTLAMVTARTWGERYIGDLTAYAAGRDGAIPVEVLDGR